MAATETEVSLDDLALPEALKTLLVTNYGTGEAARRAALAPWPELNFCSAVKERDLFRDRARLDNPRRITLERLLRQESWRFAPDQPFFTVEGTTGKVQSPYTELTDAEFWIFVCLWGDEPYARRELESKYRVLGNRSAIEYLRRYRQPGLGAWVDRLLHGPSASKDPLETVFTWHCRSRGGIYA